MTRSQESPRANSHLPSLPPSLPPSDGTVLNSNNLWVNVLDPTGAIERQDWKDNYEKIRKALGADDPVRLAALPPALLPVCLP